MMESVITVREYIDAGGHSAFGAWFESLDPTAAARVTIALERIAAGHRSAMKAVGAGVSEYRIDTGPGYRIYFGKDGARLVILLGGGTKRKQESDIAIATQAWADYKRRKKDEDR